MSKFSKEIFMVCNFPDGKFEPIIARYTNKRMFNTMLARFQQWDRQGKLHIIEVRNF